jgi:C-terminal processing protease CtpA/Prc
MAAFRSGIEPDIKVASADAFKAAHLDALQKLRTTTTDSRHQQELDRAIATLQGAK